MELRQLHYFVAVADTLSFTRAAEILHVSQPALSSQIANLEEEMGAQLLTRTKRSVILTPVGAAFLTDARELLRRAEYLTDSVRTGVWGQMDDHRFHIGYEPVIVDNPEFYRILVHAIQYMREEYQTNNVRFQNTENKSYKESLTEEKNDLILTMSPERKAPNDFAWEKLAETELVLVTYSETPLPDTRDSVLRILTEKDLFLSQENVAGLSDILRILSGMEVTPKIRFNKQGPTTSLMVASGAGATILPAGALRSFTDVPNVRMLHLDPEYKLGVYAAWEEENENPMIPVFLKMLKEQLQSSK